jgi:hypothetical protein
MLPNLPLEIINKILIMRQPHQNAELIKHYINHYKNGTWYYKTSDIQNFHHWFFREKYENRYNQFKNKLNIRQINFILRRYEAHNKDIKSYIWRKYGYRKYLLKYYYIK